MQGGGGGWGGKELRRSEVVAVVVVVGFPTEWRHLRLHTGQNDDEHDRRDAAEVMSPSQEEGE